MITPSIIKSTSPVLPLLLSAGALTIALKAPIRSAAPLRPDPGAIAEKHYVDLCRDRDWRHARMLGEVRADQPVQAVFGRDFPLATLSINVIGSFLMGFLFILTLERLMFRQASGSAC